MIETRNASNSQRYTANANKITKPTQKVKGIIRTSTNDDLQMCLNKTEESKL